MQILIVAVAALLCTAFIFSPISAGASIVSGPIIMSTNERSYVVGELVNIKGQITPPVVAGQLLVIQIFSPDGKFYSQSELEVARDGVFSWSFLPSGGTGEWTINAQFSTKEAEATFTVTNEELFDKVVMANPVLLDIQGREISSGKAGDNVIITASIANDEPDAHQPFVFIVQITNEQGTVELVSLTLGSLAPSQDANPSVGWLPEKQGTYIAEIFVWSSLGTPRPLVEKQMMTFSIA